MVSSLEASLKPYQSERWYQMDSTLSGFVPTTTMCSFGPFLLRLREFLSLLRESLSIKMYSVILLEFADRLRLSFESIVTELRFNEVGAKQFSYDLQTTFFPLISSYGIVVDRHFKVSEEWLNFSVRKYLSCCFAHFKQIKDVLSLLTLPAATLACLKQCQGTNTEYIFAGIGLHPVPNLANYLSLRVDIP